MSEEHVIFIVALSVGFGSGAAFGSSCALRWARKQQELFLADLRRPASWPHTDAHGNSWNGPPTIEPKP